VWSRRRYYVYQALGLADAEALIRNHEPEVEAG